MISSDLFQFAGVIEVGVIFLSILGIATSLGVGARVADAMERELGHFLVVLFGTFSIFWVTLWTLGATPTFESLSDAWPWIASVAPGIAGFAVLVVAAHDLIEMAEPALVERARVVVSRARFYGFGLGGLVPVVAANALAGYRLGASFLAYLGTPDGKTFEAGAFVGAAVAAVATFVIYGYLGMEAERKAAAVKEAAEAKRAKRRRTIVVTDEIAGPAKVAA